MKRSANKPMPVKKAQEKNKAFLLPKPFPDHLPRPPTGFLRNEPPYEKSFAAALKLPYHGFVVDEDIIAYEKELQNHLTAHEHWFRQDVTQPFGLGTKCAKTYVTRCLMGDRGTTYKYLGLRMFAHGWSNPIQQLRTRLTDRTEWHLKQLKRPVVHGRAAFDVCLINRMESSAKLKPITATEPITDPETTTTTTIISSNLNRAAVSWHADSSLEHYSTIAVYQTLLLLHQKEQNQTKRKLDEWSIGLRVAPFSEGPKAGHMISSSISTTPTTEIESAAITQLSSTPPIAVSIPSNSAYYLLDDFNHHHQHAVFTNTCVPSVIRYSLTFRLLREGHTIEFQLDRCRRVIANFNKKGTKVFRSEQLLLTEIESEWLRQFYIQGRSHHDLLYTEWGESLQCLWQFWSQLESRTYQILQFFQQAVEAKELDRPNRKQTKALENCGAILDRESTTFLQLIGSFVNLISERAVMRRLWREREQDSVFQSLPDDLRPVPFPALFGTNEAEASVPSEGGRSPLPDILDDVIGQLQALPRRFESKAKTENLGKPWDWQGWGNYDFALEMQTPWAESLLNGSKSIETRSYPLPPALLGKQIAILRSDRGEAGKSALADRINFDKGDSPQIVGWCTFSSMIEYTTRAQFEQDEPKHLVNKASGYGWKEDTGSMYGWVVHQYEQSLTTREFSHALRRNRSLFQLFRRGDKKSSTLSQRHKRQDNPRKKKRRF